MDVLATSLEPLAAVAALIVSACVAIPTVLSLRRAKPESAMTQLLARIGECETQIRDLKADLVRCSEQREQLERENLRLMRELFRAKNGGGHE